MSAVDHVRYHHSDHFTFQPLTMSVLTCLDPTTTLLGVVMVLSLLWWLSTRRPPGLPPGPGPALPLLGHLHLMEKNPLAQFNTWRRHYGDVFSLYMGGRLVVVLNGFPVIKEALVKFADVFSDRPHLFMFEKIGENKGYMANFFLFLCNFFSLSA